MSQEVDWLEVPDPDEHLASAVGAFTEVFATAPDGVWAAPGRVNLIGEHVDYNGGPVLPVAIGHRAMLAGRRRDDGRVRLASVQDAQAWEGSTEGLVPGSVPGWGGYAVGVLWALQQAGHDMPGVDLLVDGRVPVGSGLSSSASLTCSVAVALADLAGLPGADAADDPGRRALAEACVQAENRFAGAPTGGMDQSVALRARAGHALLLDCSTFEAEHIPVPVGEGLSLVVVDTRAHHSLVDGQYGGRRAACERAAQELGVPLLGALRPDELDDALSRLGDDELRRCVRHVVTEVDRVRRVADLLRAGRLRETGPVLLDSHASMRDDFRISAPELDLAVASAVDVGALGARMTGGGFGGSAVLLCETDAVEAVAEGVTAAFAAEGFRAPGVLPTSPAGPAERVA